MNMKQIKQLNDLDKMFREAVKSVDPYLLIKENIIIKNRILIIKSIDKTVSYDLSVFNRIFITGAGKASFKMASAIEEILGDRISQGIVSVKKGYRENLTEDASLKKINIIEAGHPVPDINSVKAAHEIENLSKKSDKKTLFINLISGGGSALLCYPLKCENHKINIKDIQKTNSVLLECGADIKEMNCIRKHISGIKGGRLLRMFYPATSISLILSDVIGNRLDTIASGLTTFDKSTFADADSVIRKYNIEKKLPIKVLKIIRAGCEGKIKETIKNNDIVLEKTENILIGSNSMAVNAACTAAEELGYNAYTPDSNITGEAKEAAKIFTSIAENGIINNIPVKKPACIIAGGETTVTMQGNGKGGRNQELALSFLKESGKIKVPYKNNIYFLSASTDGNDGPTDAAGAFACSKTLEISQNYNLNIDKYLNNNDSYNFFDKTGFLYKTGITNTNVCDIQILIIDSY